MEALFPHQRPWQYNELLAKFRHETVRGSLSDLIAVHPFTSLVLLWRPILVPRVSRHASKCLELAVPSHLDNVAQDLAEPVVALILEQTCLLCTGSVRRHLTLMNSVGQGVICNHFNHLQAL